MYRKLLLSKILFFFIFTINAQTCVVGIVTGDSIVLGADSRTTRYIEKNNSFSSFPDSTCKIRNIGNVNFVNIGNFADIAATIAYETSRKHSRFKNVVIEFTQAFRQKTLQILDEYKTKSPTIYNKILSDSIMSQIVFFGYEDDSAVFVPIIYKVKEKSNGSITIYSLINPSAGGIIAGEILEIENLFFETKTWENGPVSGIQYLIQLASKYHPSTIALPVDIISVKKDGIRWIERKKMCIY